MIFATSLVAGARAVASERDWTIAVRSDHTASGSGEVLSDSHVPTIFPRRFPPKFHLLMAVRMLWDESAEVHLEDEASQFR